MILRRRRLLPLAAAIRTSQFGFGTASFSPAQPWKIQKKCIMHGWAFPQRKVNPMDTSKDAPPDLLEDLLCKSLC